MDRMGKATEEEEEQMRGKVSEKVRKWRRVGLDIADTMEYMA